MGGTTTSIPGMSVTGSGEKVFPVMLIAKPGILQGHGRDDTEYRDLTPGAASLASGIYLKTLEEGAAIILPDNSVMMMDAGTEVQLGMYDNGIMVWQHSGQTYHFVMPNQDRIYEVATPFGTFVAHGTEFEVRVDYPAEGWVVVFWGEIGVVDPVTGQEFITPEGAILLGPEGTAESWSLAPGEDMAFQVDPNTGEVVPTRGSAVHPNNDWSRRNDLVAEAIRDVIHRFNEGSITLDEYNQSMNDLITQALGLAENEPRIPAMPEGGSTPTLAYFGKRWASKGQDIPLVTFCFDGSYISWIGWVTDLTAETLDTGEVWINTHSFHMYEILVEVKDTGHFAQIYQVAEPLFTDFEILFMGTLSGGEGRVFLNGSGLTDVEFSYSGSQYFNVYASDSDCYY
jgi:hypothetical protein